ncbi:DUF4383 domain-containing protein [Altererythrobacter arenosus]|uniref:DUF4383 domain-containing protein n=1 Tax=Altererythrobacter arenosus TaxID=3032592 RepID=A0ABY8FRT3_9SPHN|nr:DUF4383 domain-containing protein [Altererythrobacter sp. CAU 1644]WFL77728.1 DUF4383 domain-containing protein [Altererythrobacter sp. CAU 1644]
MIEAKILARVLGATFIGVGLLGFVPNPLVAPDGIFAVNTMHNLVHIVTGAGFLIGASMGKSRATIIGIGIGYVAVAVLGFMTDSHLLLGMIHINEADRWLHAGLAIAILAGGFLSKERAIA